MSSYELPEVFKFLVSYSVLKYDNNLKGWHQFLILKRTDDEIAFDHVFEKDKTHEKTKPVTYVSDINIDNDLRREYITFNHLGNEIKIFADEYRICGMCGNIMFGGMTDEWDFYSCEKCFEKAMDECYGKGKWRSSGAGVPGEWDGYYEHLNSKGKWEDTGIYYTEWN